MKSPAAIQLVPLGDKYLIMYYNEQQREDFLRDGVVDDEMVCKAYTIPDGFEVSNAFIDLMDEGNVNVTIIEKE